MSACPTMRRPRPGTPRSWTFGSCRNGPTATCNWPTSVRPPTTTSISNCSLVQIPHLNPVLDDLGVSLEYGGYQHFCLHVDNVDAVRAELIRRGVDVVGEPFEIEDISRRLALFRDPWGNMIELSETLPGAGA